MTPLLAALLLTLAPQEAESTGERGDLRWSDDPGPVEVVEGPVLLHGDVFTQWGGHTFAYVVEGREHVFWTGLDAYEGPAVVARFPRPGSEGAPQITRLPIDPGTAGTEDGVYRMNPPQMVRTPDGYLHVFAGTKQGEQRLGRVRYFRSARPEDVSELLDRTERLPLITHDDFQTRQSVGLSRDGRRIVFVNLTNFVRNKHSMNVPLIWIGERDGLDFQFREPVVYGEPTAFFYPQVAATENGPVLLGAVHREPDRGAELVHLDWEGRVLEWLPLPRPPGTSWAFDLQPLDPDDWSVLVLARHVLPAEGTLRRLEFWSYDTRTRELRLERGLEGDLASEPSFASAGKFWIVPDGPPLFLNEPGSRNVRVWSGDLFGDGPLVLGTLGRTTVSEFGFEGIRSMFFPSVLQGSVAGAGGLRPLAVDVSLPYQPEQDDRCAFLLWWVRRR